MTVFKAYLKVLLSSKFTIIIYVVMLIIFASLNIQNDSMDTNFTSSRPDVLIINNDENTGITKSLIDYISLNSNIIEIENDEEKINDALFYRDVNFIIYIPSKFRQDFLNGNMPNIEIKQTNDYKAQLAYNTLSKYLNTIETYRSYIKEEDKIIEKTNETLKTSTEVEISSSINNAALTQAKAFFNFSNF